MALSLQRYIRYHYDDCRLASLLNQRKREERERSMAIVIKKADHLPENMIIEIFSWLPVKDLLRYKTLSKSWYAIISSPNFIAKHLNNYYNNNNDWRACLLVLHYVTHAELQLYELFVDETTRVLAEKVLHAVPIYCSFICGPCDGLYYVYEYDYGKRGLWNPSINQFVCLPNVVCMPDPPPNSTYAKDEVFGFGLDHDNGDYKVVVIKGYWRATLEDSDVDHPPSLLVYSLRTNLWRYCGDLAKVYHLESNRCYIYVNGCCYWLGFLGLYEDGIDVIISYNFATDAIQEIDVPDYAQPSTKCLGIYDDSLAFLCVQENDKVLDVWTWNFEGSWTKKLTVGPITDVRRPVGHWKDNRLILQCDYGNLVVFDPETQGVKDLGFQNARWCDGVFAYMESLVSIKERFDHPDSADDEAEAEAEAKHNNA